MRVSRKWAVGTLAVFFAAMVGVWALWIVGSNPVHYLEVLDGLAAPDAWQLSQVEVVDRGNIAGPSATRYYVTREDPQSAATEAADALRAGGFSLRTPSGPCESGSDGACPPDAVERCRSNGVGGPVTCHLASERGSDAVDVDVFGPGASDGRAVRGRSTALENTLIRVVARRSP